MALVKHQAASAAVTIAQQSVFTTLFGFFTTPAGKELLMTKELLGQQLPLQMILLPTAALFELAELILAIKEISRLPQEQRTTEKYLQLAVTCTKTLTIMIAIGIGVAATAAGAAAAPAVVPILFTTALGISAFNKLGKFFYHLGRMHECEKQGKNGEAAIHQKAMHEHLLGFITGTMLVSTIVGLFVLGVSSGVGLAALSGIGLTAMVAAVAVPRLSQSGLFGSKEKATTTDPLVTEPDSVTDHNSSHL